MSQVTTEELESINAAVPKFASLLIRLGRNWQRCMSAPNRSENDDAESKFADALTDLVVAVVAMIRSQDGK